MAALPLLAESRMQRVDRLLMLVLHPFELRIRAEGKRNAIRQYRTQLLQEASYATARACHPWSSLYYVWSTPCRLD